jgi:transposase
MAKIQKPHVHLTTMQEAQLADLYARYPEITVIELAREFTIARWTVSRIVRRQGGQVRSKALDEMQRERIVELYRKGHCSRREIALTVGCHVSTVRRVLEAMLLPEERQSVPGRKPHKRLSRAEQAALAERYAKHPETTVSELAREFNIGRTTVAVIVRRQGGELRRDQRRKNALQQQDRERIAELYRGGRHSAREIAVTVGCHQRAVRRVLEDMLAPKERRSIIERRTWARRKYHYRRHLFVEPLSDAELWLFGLLMADGNVSHGRRVSLRLSVRDRDAVESARQVAGSNAPIVVVERREVNPMGIRGGRAVLWTLHSREIVSRLIAMGMVRAKSYRDDVRVKGAVAQSPSFWRGVIDGDGSIGWSRSRGRANAYLQVLGGRRLLDQWAMFVVDGIGDPKPRVRPRRDTKRLYQSALGWSRAWRMVEILYGHGGPALERKRNAALEILASPPPVPQVIGVEVIKLAIAELRKRPLHEVPQRYVCPRTGVQLGQLLHRARGGSRPDLHELFAGHDPQWRR